MPRGRPTKPTHLKELTGTLRKCRVNNAEPKTLPGIPVTPSGLSHVGKKKFNELCQELYQMKVITTHDAQLLEMIAHQWENYIELKKELKKNGRFYHSTTEEMSEDGLSVTIKRGIKVHPALAAFQMSWSSIMKGLQECGLTPSTRSKLRMVEKEEENPFLALLKNQ